jgi:hypothetical protein
VGVNFYNLAVRADDALVDQCAEQGIASLAANRVT